MGTALTISEQVSGIQRCQVPDYGIVFLNDEGPFPVATTFLVADSKIVRIIYHTSSDGLFKLDYGLEGGKILLVALPCYNMAKLEHGQMCSSRLARTASLLNFVPIGPD